MTTKEKAAEIYFKMMEQSFGGDSEQSKQCALIAVDELINDCDASSPFEVERLKWWQQVKTEIQNL